MGQLPLDLVLPTRLGRDDFLRAPANAAALDLIEAWPAWPDRILVLTGPPGAGKSHLGAIWAALAGAVAAEPDAPGAALAAVRPAGAILLEDADRLGWPEPALFHLLNHVREGGGWLLATAAAPPAQWGLRTPDLVSRLRLAPLVAIGAPDDALMRAVLVKLFADRQIAVEETLLAYLVPRLARSLDVARAVAGALDRAALAGNRRLTRAVAAEVLGALDLDEAEP